MRSKIAPTSPELEKQRLRRELSRARHRLDRHVDRLLGRSLAAEMAAAQQPEGEAPAFDWRAHVRRYPQWSLLAAFALGWLLSSPSAERCLGNIVLGVLMPVVRPWLEKLVATVSPAAEGVTPAAAQSQGVADV